VAVRLDRVSVRGQPHLADTQQKIRPGTVREQLRHRDLKSIEHCLDYVNNEELIASGKVDSG
jgi:hypothetical protein